MPDPTLYLFDGHNILHAGEFRESRALVDRLASFVALRGARGVVVFDGTGEDTVHGSLEVRYAPSADAVLERLAAENRASERVCVVSSDQAVRGTAGQQVRHLSAQTFVRELAVEVESAERAERTRSQVEDALDEETRERLERWRRRRY